MSLGTLGSYSGPFNHPMGDSPPEPSASCVKSDIEDHVKRYNSAKEDLEGSIECIKESKATMKDCLEYLEYEYDMDKDAVESYSNE